MAMENTDNPSASDSETAIPIYEDTSYSFEERAADLLARMSVEQKGSQIIERASAIPASKLDGGAMDVEATKSLSAYDWWSEALHGYSNADALNGNSCNNSTSYPTNEAVGSTWNRDLYYEEAVQIGQEIRERTAKNELGNSLSLNMYSPTVNMHRDPRWGRNEESYSEDPLLMGEMAKQFVNGVEGKDQDGNLIEDYYQVHTTIKHYLANNTENIRLVDGADLNMRQLYEYYASPYRTVIEDANVSSVMTAYSTVNGEPSSYSSFLMDTLLRQTFGLTGYITSDCDSVSTMARLKHINPYTGEVLTTVEQYASALAHGEDLECASGYDSSNNANYSALAQAMVDEAPENDTGKFTENTLDIAVHRLLTARIATGEFDENNPYTEAAEERVALQQDASSNTSPDAEVYWQTNERIDLAEKVAEEAVVLLKNEDNMLPLTAESGNNIVIVGSWQTNMYLGVYTSSQQITPNHVNIAQGITDAVMKVNPDAEITYIAADILTPDDEKAIEDADVAIVVVGTDQKYSREDGDRSSIALPNGLDDFIAQVADLNEHTVAIMETCGPMEVSKFEGKVKALLWSSFNGIRKGVGFGNVITGAVNPSGHLTDTWYTSDAEIPDIMDYNLYATEGSKGRTYMYYTGTPQYPFGYGLSYTTFEYSNLTLDKSQYDANDTITATFDVENTGDVAGKEVVQLYVAQPDAPKELNRPIRRLESFDKIELQPGEKQTITMTVAIPDLAYFDEDPDVMAFKVDEGAYQVQVGGDSASADLTADLTVSGAMDVYPKLLTVKAAAKGDSELGIEQRLIYEKGMEIEPKLTVAMNDESLHGYVIAHQNSLIRNVESSPLPEGMTFTYESNRPEVVSVSEDGQTIKAIGIGVATITVTGTLDDHTVETSFVAYVDVSPAIDGVEINGEPLESFDSEKFNYELTGYDAIPTVEVINDNEELTITVEQAESVPGVATITSICPDNNEEYIYRIGFGKEPVSTDFAKDDLADWTIQNPDAAAVKIDENGLTITAGEGTFGVDAKNVYLGLASGNWVAQTHLTLDPAISAAGQEAGMTVYDAQNNYIRYAYQNDGSLNVYLAQEVEPVANVTIESCPDSLYLQVVKQGSGYQFNYSLDGIEWNAVGSGSTECEMALPQVGVYATAGSAEAFAASFDGVSIFDVEELYPRLSDIKVNGQSILGFNSETFIYNQFVETGASDVPEIEAAPVSPSHKVTVSGLSAPFGVATVTVSSEAASQSYEIAFNHDPVNDYFADGDYDSDNWEILNEADTETAYYRVETGEGIVVPTQPSSFFASGSELYNLFVTPAQGNWEIVAKVVFPQLPAADSNQMATLLIWQDGNNNIRLSCMDASLNIMPVGFTNGNFGGMYGNGAAQAAEDGTATLYFKIRKTNNTYDLGYSQDGINYTEIGTAENIDLLDPKIGLLASENGDVEPIEINFEYLYVTDRNGTAHGSEPYESMLNWAAQNVADYVAAAVPETVTDDIEFAAIPHGYELSVVSSSEDVISNDGKVTQGTEDQSVSLIITVNGADGEVTAMSTAEVTVPKAD